MESGEGCSRIQDAAGLCGCRGITDIGTSHSNLYALYCGTPLLPGKPVRVRDVRRSVGSNVLAAAVRAFFPGKQFDYGTIRGVKDPNWMMILPLTVFAVAMFCFGLHPAPLLELFRQVVSVF